MTKNRIALAMAIIGELWLIVVMSGCLPKPTPNNNTPLPPTKSLLTMAHE